MCAQRIGNIKKKNGSDLHSCFYGAVIIEYGISFCLYGNCVMCGHSFKTQACLYLSHLSVTFILSPAHHDWYKYGSC